MARNLEPGDVGAIEKVRKQKCPDCNGPMVPRHAADGTIVRALVCPKHGEFTTPQGRAKVREIRAERGMDDDG